MALPVAFSLLQIGIQTNSSFAEIGTAENGMALSTVSALTQLGLDPWEEAAQLSKLPRRRRGTTHDREPVAPGERACRLARHREDGDRAGAAPAGVSSGATPPARRRRAAARRDCVNGR